MSDLASQFEKAMMAHAFLEHVDQLLTVARASLAKDPCLAVTAIFQTWLQWFKTAGSGVEWLELATVERECHQLYEQYRGEEWALVNPFLEFLMDDLMAGMTVSALAVASASDTTKHPVGALAVVRGEGWSKGCGGEEAANHGDIQEAGPSTPKAAAGSVTRGLVTTPRSKGKGKAKAQDEEDKDIEEQIEEMFTNKHLVTLLHWQKALTVVDTSLGAGVKLEKAKGKCDNCWADNDPEGCCTEGEGNVEMRETTPLVIVAEVEWEASNIEVKGKEEFEAAPAAIEEDEEEERAEEVKGTWSDTPLHQVGNNELKWLGEDLGWPTPLMSVASLADFNKRAAGVEWWFQRELEAARKELLVAWAHYTVAKQTLAILAGYWCDCQTFLAWQEENNIREGDWEEAEDPVEVPNNDADLNT
ncbi:hypothetical protein J132_07369 [Termitomyces sp. J132]|nr:hypothetical protein J132_07369 [Termitomyces sp. J132]